jgi:hypothetical protein
VDVDAYVAAHQAEWDRLDDLVARRRRLSGDEVDELVTTYQRATTHLSALRTAGHDPALVARLSTRVARARSAVTGAHSPSWRSVGRFAVVSFPVMAYRARWWWLGTAAGSLLVALVMGLWIARSPAVQASLLPRAAAAQLVRHEFRDYYSQYAATSFAARVWTNNAWVAAESLTFGILLGVPTLLVLFENAANIGIDGGLMFAHGRGVEFFALILPHGMLELSAVFLAAAGPGPGRRGPRDDHDRARADRGAAGVRGDRGVRHPLAAGYLGPDPDRGLRGGGLPRLRDRARAPRGGGRAVSRHRGRP